jgi:hypothetical protein
MPMAFASTKGLNENLAPLRRFLVSRVGRSWDTVYSEIRTRLSPRNTIDMHVWQHLFDYVLFARPSRKGGIQLVRRTGEVLAEIAPGRRWHLPRAWRRREWVWVGLDGILCRPHGGPH